MRLNLEGISASCEMYLCGCPTEARSPGKRSYM